MSIYMHLASSEARVTAKLFEYIVSFFKVLFCNVRFQWSVFLTKNEVCYTQDISLILRLFFNSVLRIKFFYFFALQIKWIIFIRSETLGWSLSMFPFPIYISFRIPVFLTSYWFTVTQVDFRRTLLGSKLDIS